jgi:hypothetical protein
MREVNLSQSLTSIVLIFSLLISVVRGDVNAFVNEVGHGALIVEKADTETKQGTHIPFGFNGKEEENRSEKKSSDQPTAYLHGEVVSPIVTQCCDFLHTQPPTRTQGITKVPRYLLERSLLI